MRPTLIALVATLFLACALPAQIHTNISGVVLSSGDPVPGVTVTVENLQTGLKRSAITGGDGGFVVSEIPTGRYRVTAALEGFASRAVEGDIRPGQSNFFEIDFQPITRPATGSIYGRVTDRSTGAPLADVEVTIHDVTNNLSGVVTTDGDGNYEKTGLTPGPYEVTAAKSGYTSQEKRTIVRVGVRAKVNFNLRRSQ